MRSSKTTTMTLQDDESGPMVHTTGTGVASAGAAEGSGGRTASTRLEKLHSIQHMDAVIRRETSRADRSGREFSLVLFRIKRSKRHSISTHRLIKTITARARNTDEVGWFGDRHVCVVLPETPLAGAWVFADSVCDLAAKRIPRPVAIVYSYPGNWFAGGAQSGASEKPNNRFNDRRPVGGRIAEFQGVGSGDAAFDNADRDAAGHPSTGLEAPGDTAAIAEDLRPYFVTGVKAGLARQEMPAGSVETLLARPMPLWKRAIDIAGASVGIMLASPFMLFAWVGIKLTSPGPAIFKQKRAGLGGRPFTIYKFRTMNVNAEAQKKELRAKSEQDGPAFKLTHDPRVFKFGSLLRKSSIDELPQLFNVLKGDMSIVGPRPLPVDEANNCAGWQRRRLDVTPGMTCIWQIFGRSKVTFSEWVRMDVAYIRRRTILHDLKLIFMTVPAVLMRRGAK